MKKPVSARIPKDAMKLFESHHTEETISKQVEDAIGDLKGLCPMCQRVWPTKDDIKEKFSARISDSFYKFVQSRNNSSRFLAIAICKATNVCPLCEKKL
jgi:hypothetical protein